MTADPHAPYTVHLRPIAGDESYLPASSHEVDTWEEAEALFTLRYGHVTDIDGTVVAEGSPDGIIYI